MDKLKKFFPLSYKVDTTSVSLVKALVFYALISFGLGLIVAPFGAIAGILVGVFGIGLLLLPIVFAVAFAGGTYCLAGSVLAIVEFVKLRKADDGIIETTAEEITEEKTEA